MTDHYTTPYYLLGQQEELKLKPEIEKYFNINLKEQDRYSLVDFISDDDKYYVELKSRNCNFNKYTSTIITEKKVHYFKQLLLKNKIVILIFKFYDGVYYCKFDNDIYEKSLVSQGGRIDRGHNEIQQYLYIPISLLIRLP